MLLLLILFAGCLATSAAQTTAFPSPVVVNVTAPGVLQTTADPREYVAILQAGVKSTTALNNNTFAPILAQLRGLIIEQLQKDPGITLIVRNITKV